MNFTVSTCTLNQWALDFDGNYERIRESILRAKSDGSHYRVGPELEISGYGCNDHFFEADTTNLSMEILEKLVLDSDLYGIICDVGMPLRYKDALYNCRVIFFNGKVCLIRPKMHLANDGNYREGRWFSAWKMTRYVSNDYFLPFSSSTYKVPFGDAVLCIKSFQSSNFGILRLGFETCEEMFVPNPPHISQGLDGVDIFVNSSASHHELRKLHKRIDLIRNATSQSGGLYIYSNLRGCDGERVYYDGCSMIVLNGEIVAQGMQFSVHDVEVISATIDIEDIICYRTSSTSRSSQMLGVNEYNSYTQVVIDLERTSTERNAVFDYIPKKPVYLIPEEEISLGPACWLWDYLRRSKMRGFFLPLSGGIDSCATALIVYSMCRMVFYEVSSGNEIVLRDLRQVLKDKSFIPISAENICGNLFFTCYMGTSNSSETTCTRAKLLSKSIGSSHIDCNIDEITKSFSNLFFQTTHKSPKFKVNGGTSTENLALQNIQARSRMVLSYLFAQLLPWANESLGSLLVLGSSNVDECLRGYFTKYDCSSADLNPIGSISKKDLKLFVNYAKSNFNLSILDSFINAIPTAELEPITEDYVQSDETDMGMTYEELSIFGKLRKKWRCGPIQMTKKLLIEWKEKYPTSEIISKVKRFFFFYSINRHKMTTLTPSYHAENYSPDDNRFDMRPFLYNSEWNMQFRIIDKFQNKQ